MNSKLFDNISLALNYIEIYKFGLRRDLKSNWSFIDQGLKTMLGNFHCNIIKIFVFDEMEMTAIET